MDPFHLQKASTTPLSPLQHLQFCESAGELIGFFVHLDELYKKAPGLFGSFAIFCNLDATKCFYGPFSPSKSVNNPTLSPPAPPVLRTSGRAHWLFCSS